MAIYTKKTCHLLRKLKIRLYIIHGRPILLYDASARYMTVDTKQKALQSVEILIIMYNNRQKISKERLYAETEVLPLKQKIWIKAKRFFTDKVKKTSHEKNINIKGTRFPSRLKHKIINYSEG